jgi:anti-sigma factor RsiW
MSNDSENSEFSADAVADEQLVAYLDGELDDETSHRIEALLASDPKLRRQLGQLEQTWEALEQLERSEVGEKFAQTTLEMVAVAAEEDIERLQEEAPRVTRKRLLSGGLWLALAAVIGFGTVALFWPDANRQLLENLPVLEHLEQYRQIDDIEFLRQLDEQHLFPETTDGK